MTDISYVLELLPHMQHGHKHILISGKFEEFFL